VTTPKAIYTELEKHVIGQEHAKKILSISAHHHELRKNVGGLTKRNNVLLVGPTGSGKTLLIQTLAEILKVPYTYLSATEMTANGYVGMDASECLQQLLAVARRMGTGPDHGIIFIDMR
jgi:ATP-dependent Clp protease ATP-binding subunit ClpX